ncbi:hypothetical protein ymoll0001_3900 [Yersinia mollaretii ATCC 43969]|uniref:Uncharacterized protein n=1 Tax=Yersinia mollaretii (strain ATCC 43969 / DSM 18520 / CIP 103324 / CNY 7263 / WAIP 204) TaxID=349967 RepID=A0ABM9YCU1_YERMW|nr:hypothetical protein ymoll0001_3900 [Yersinia mollaretii ATCC 43969]
MFLSIMEILSLGYPDALTQYSYLSAINVFSVMFASFAALYLMIFLQTGRI